jgi:hypothetical protein
LSLGIINGSSRLPAEADVQKTAKVGTVTHVTCPPKLYAKVEAIPVYIKAMFFTTGYTGFHRVRS